ncbi:MAG: cell division protein FtsQ [Fimbriimonadaceae bacterium]|jgi:hypothetical protein|nr:cell division protein FtsQ [Fimbriimonadaceae bacterium]
MPPKRKKKAINWGPVLAIALAVNVVLGLFLSPITSVRKLRILGAQPHDTTRLRELAHSLQGVPFGLMPAERFESEVLRQRDVYNADLSHNLFGSGVLRLQYRRPVAILLGVPNTYLDDQGVLYGSPEVIPGIRQLSLQEDYMQPVVALTQPWPSAVVAHLCNKLDSFAELEGGVVHLDTTGRLWISKENSGKVDLGGTEALDEKLRKLRQLLDDEPTLLSKVKTLTLTDPSRPALDNGKGTSR